MRWYMPYRQTSDWQGMETVVRSPRPPASLAPEVRAALAAYDPSLPTGELYELDRLIDSAVAPRRLTTQVLGPLPALALALAALGLDGVVAYSVTQRTQERRIRMAIGAQRRDVVALVVLGGLKPVGLGIALGAGGSPAPDPAPQLAALRCDRARPAGVRRQRHPARRRGAHRVPAPGPARHPRRSAAGPARGLRTGWRRYPLPPAALRGPQIKVSFLALPGRAAAARATAARKAPAYDSTIAAKLPRARRPAQRQPHRTAAGLDGHVEAQEPAAPPLRVDRCGNRRDGVGRKHEPQPVIDIFADEGATARPDSRSARRVASYSADRLQNTGKSSCDTRPLQSVSAQLVELPAIGLPGSSTHSRTRSASMPCRRAIACRRADTPGTQPGNRAHRRPGRAPAAAGPRQPG